MKALTDRVSLQQSHNVTQSHQRLATGRGWRASLLSKLGSRMTPVQGDRLPGKRDTENDQVQNLLGGQEVAWKEAQGCSRLSVATVCPT